MTFSDRLRADLWPLIGERRIAAVAEEIGISRTTLWKFLKGDAVGARAVDRIDHWVRVRIRERNIAGNG